MVSHVVDSGERCSGKIGLVSRAPVKERHLAYYSVFLLGPIILIAIVEAGLLWTGCSDNTGDVITKRDAGGTGAKADAGKRKPSRRRCSCNRPWDRRFTIRCHRRRRPIEGALNVVW